MPSGTFPPASNPHPDVERAAASYRGANKKQDPLSRRKLVVTSLLFLLFLGISVAVLLVSVSKNVSLEIYMNKSSSHIKR